MSLPVITGGAGFVAGLAIGVCVGYAYDVFDFVRQLHRAVRRLETKERRRK